MSTTSPVVICPLTHINHPMVDMLTQSDTHTVFSHLAHLPWAMLLDSATSQHPDARFDIIVANPIATITADEKQTNVTLLNTPANPLNGQHTDNPLDILRKVIEQTLDESAISNVKRHAEVSLPFVAGAMGLFSYDLGRRLETLPATATHDLHIPDMAVGIYEWSLIFDKHTQLWWFTGVNVDPLAVFELFEHAPKPLQEPSQGFELSSDWRPNMQFDEYKQAFDKIQQYLLEGDCYQINLTQRFESTYHGDEFAAYQQLCAANQAPFSAFLRFDDFAVMSISPERFISLHDQQLQTKPIKGTLHRGNTPEEDQQLADTLAKSIKDQAENVMIVDLLRNDLSRVAQAGSVKVPKLFDIESFPAVHHLVSTVTATLQAGKTGTDVLKHTFPGGSITGAPKIRAMEIIEELEVNRRNAYCGSIGYLCASGDMDTSITIRTLVAKDEQLYCWAGGGIVVDSTVESEYRELYAKVNKILPILKPKKETA